MAKDAERRMDAGMKPPAAPPPLKAMDARRRVLEDARAALHHEFTAALESCDGNIDRAARSLGMNEAIGKYRASVLGLREFARALRIAAGQPATGRPRGINFGKKKKG